MLWPRYFDEGGSFLEEQAPGESSAVHSDQNISAADGPNLLVDSQVLKEVEHASRY